MRVRVTTVAEERNKYYLLSDDAPSVLRPFKLPTVRTHRLCCAAAIRWLRMFDNKCL